MPLQGNVESFGISEIFQLISHQGKTGTLEIQTGNGAAKLRFLEGNLVEAWPDKRSPAELIGSRLIRAGLITPAQLGHALESQRQNLRRLGDILIRMGALRISEFQGLLALQHRETVYGLLRLKRGEFQFKPGHVEIEEGVSVPMDVGSLLMEGFRQIDEWPSVTEKIPSENKIYIQVEGEEPQAVPLSAEESRVLALVDGSATVREVVDRACLGEFGGWQALAGLFDRGLITPARATRKARPEPKRLVPGRAADRLVGVLLLALTVALVAFHLSRPSPGLEGLRTARRGALSEARSIQARVDAWDARSPAHWPTPSSGE